MAEMFLIGTAQREGMFTRSGENQSVGQLEA